MCLATTATIISDLLTVDNSRFRESKYQHTKNVGLDTPVGSIYLECLPPRRQKVG